MGADNRDVAEAILVMSGICGLVNFDDTSVDREILTAMTHPVSHRGPDGITYWNDTNVGFAHLKLITTPESIHEQQPLVSGDVIVTAAARIDNRDELQRVLSSFLRTDSPTDVDLIAAAYHHWGSDCATHLIGDFAFALWDKHSNQFFAARDPMGLRPFYYWHEGQRWAFASEVKQLLAVPYIPARIHEPALGIHMTGPFMPLDWTFYEGIQQLEPGQAVLVSSDGQRLWRFWEANPAKSLRYKHETEYAEHFRELFKEAVACRLRSVRPIGLSLSGGVDSGSVAATIGWLYRHNKVSQVPFSAYCYAFDELVTSDERHISRGITDYYSLSQIDVPADDLWPLKDYPQHGPDQDEPYMSPYQALNNTLLAQAQADGVGQMLAGYRGDEIVGGWYADYIGLLFSGNWRTLWRELENLRKLEQTGLSKVVQYHLMRPIRNFFWPRDGLRALLTGKKPITRPYPAWVNPDFAKRVNLAELLRDVFYTPPTLRHYGWHQRHRQIFSRAAVDVAIDAERKRARFGMDYTDPWSDRRLAEFALAIPQWIVHRHAEPKRLARAAMQSIIPPELPHRPSKIEPHTLYYRGLKERAKDTILDLIDNSVAHDSGYFDNQVLHDTYQAYLDGITPRYEFWPSLTLELWLRRFW